MFRNLLKMSDKERWNHDDDNLDSGMPEVKGMETLTRDFDNCVRLMDAFVQSGYTDNHKDFLSAFAGFLKTFYESLNFLDALENEVRQQQAIHFLRGLKGQLGFIETFTGSKILSFEETVLSRALYRQIETRLRILAGSEYRQKWEGPNPATNRS